MKFDVREVSAVKRELDIEMPAAYWRDAVARATRDLARKVRLPGFRPGKVPTEVVRKMFGAEIESDVLERVVPELYEDAIEKTSLEPLSRPVLQDKRLPDATDQPFFFTVSFEVMPKLEIRDYQGLELKKRPATVNDEDVERALTQMREKAARFNAVERPARAGDYVVVDLVPERGAAEKNLLIAIREGEGAGDLDRGLVGKGMGETFDLEMTRPTTDAHDHEHHDHDHDHDHDHAHEEGKPVTQRFNVTVRDIKERQLPAADDDFAKEVGDHENIAELQSKLRGDLQKEAEQKSRRELVRQALDRILEKSEVVAPEVLVTKELKRQVEEVAAAFRRSGLPMDRLSLDWERMARELRPEAEKSVKLEMVFDAVAESENIGVPHDRVDERIKEIAQTARRSPEAVRAQLEKEGQLEPLAASLRRERAIDFVLDKARVTAEE